MKPIIYEKDGYWAIKDEKKGYAICKKGQFVGDIVGYASTLEQAKESIEWHKKMDKEAENERNDRN